MAGDLSMTLLYDDKPPRMTRGAETILRATKNVLTTLREIEKAQSGKRARIVWDINVYSFSDRAVIEFTAVGDRKTGRWMAEAFQARSEESSR